MGRIVRSGTIYGKPKIGEAVAQAGNGDAAGKDAEGADNYLERIAKYVPAEIVAFFIFVNSICAGAIDKHISDSSPESFHALLAKALETVTMAGFNVWIVSWGLLLLGFVLTPLYLLAVRDPNDPGEFVGLNIAVALVAFPVWAYAVGAVAFRPWYDGGLASILVAVFSVVSGAISPTLVNKIRIRFGQKS